MVLHREDTPFIAELKPSKKLKRLFVAIYTLALIAGFANALPLEAKLVVALVISLNFKFTYPKFQQEKRKLKFSKKRGWELSDGGNFTQVEIVKSTVLTPFIIFLHLRDKPAIVISNDALSERAYRQLLVKLKMTTY